ncbi:hypothetical protein QBC32DRAFT_399325 [Pseudoneurospora amorphoporcata]|uniref:NAD-dependent epimerase/dehydratase domain-containing protein n=1 Tax=Pseudoneurospora amorphoporcata TaxID=241081 RepID=A0AAN6SEF3_9PEZI|nr:hypothetical protein QBC32DRAFT_399325 [Pseudoneurospora amorphoporcata]
MASSPSPPCPQTVLVTGSSGHLGRALMLSLPSYGYTPIGIDIKPSSTCTFVGSFGDATLLQNLFSPSWLRAQPEISCFNHPNGIEPISHIIHCATLHKPHIESHTKAQFVQTNIADTLTLLEAAAATTTGTSDPLETGKEKEETTTIKSFTYISTTSTFGRSLSPQQSIPGGAPKPAAHITEQTPCLPKNIYGLTKSSAEDLCYLISSSSSPATTTTTTTATTSTTNPNLPVIILKTSRFFPEADDDADRRNMLADDENLKLCELAYRRVDIADVVSACVASIKAQTRASPSRITFGKYIISGPSPFLDLSAEDWVRLNTTTAGPAGPDGAGAEEGGASEGASEGGAEKVFAQVAERLCPGIGAVMEQKRWKWLSRVDRVYDSRLAMDEKELGWKPEWTFQAALERIKRGEQWRSGLTAEVGRLGYHDRAWGVYTTK